MEFLLPEEAAPITSRGNCTPPHPLPLLLRLPIPRLNPENYPFSALLLPPSKPPRPPLPFTTLRLTPPDALRPRYRRPTYTTIDAPRALVSG